MQDSSVIHGVLFNCEGSADLPFLCPIKATLSSSLLLQVTIDKGEGGGKAALNICRHKTVPHRLEMWKPEEVNTPEGEGGERLFFFLLEAACSIV